ncbi:MAG: hypothetical protein H6853_05475 [Rhodospirillales bacterium]|nr:hypothetical protein [Alphaproteobacteria bacterium]USO02999.1 MAG: hypothetical protein H6853_05475 [Rhodospirillales bacterium]
MDEIEKRLRQSADTCIETYKAWRKNEKDGKAREALQDSVHELRKVTSRVEIEMAVSERGEMSEKPLPIPPHRSAHKAKATANGNGNGNGNVKAPAGRTRKVSLKQEDEQED